MKIVMEIIIGGVDSEESEKLLENEIKDRIENGCTIVGQIGIGFDTEINFMSVDGSVEVKE